MPVAVQTVLWFRRAQSFMDRCQARYGDMFTLQVANEGTWVMTSDPDVVKQVFTGDPRVLHAGEGNRVLLPIAGPNSVLLLDDDQHLSQRKLLLPPFHGKRMQRYGELMTELAAQEIERWPLGQPYPLRPRMQAVTLEIILQTVFGEAHGPHHERLRSELRRLLDLASSPLRTLAIVALGPKRLGRVPSFQRDMARLDVPIYDVIAARRAEGDLSGREDIMSLLLQATHEDGSPMSDQELRDELVTLLLAGHETTANSLSWAAERLCRHPAKLERLRQELLAGESTYMQAVIQETLRLRPVISIVARRLVEPMELGGRMLPAGVSITPAIHLVHRRPDIYPEPHVFRPERFIEAEGGSPPGTYTWIPFGGGVRRCLGAAFAQFEMEAVLRELVLRRTLAPARAKSEPVYRRTITETPRHDAEVVLGRAAGVGAGAGASTGHTAVAGAGVAAA